ncbi:MAG: hybrid sensor histidine kinase/response regulator [Magnetococcales bacterium]|nr:hybrid sensor histidine kinase/response regulator [Magnetococcales bacterium]
MSSEEGDSSLDPGAETRGRVLIVDDVPENIRILVEVLRDECLITAATSGARALALAGKAPHPDLILLDIMMPEMDGFEVCRRLKENPETREIPVLFVTALSDEKDERKGLDLGAIDYIRKPISPPVVQARVRNQLTLVQAQRRLNQQNEELKEAARLREQVEHMTRHDLKGPLSAVIGFSQALRDDDALDGEQVEFLEQITSAGYLMLDMINRSLDLYKMEMGTYLYQPYSVDLVPVIHRVFKDSNATIRDKQLQTVVTLPDGETVFQLPTEELLSHALMSNLIKNAVEASHTGKKLSVVLNRDEDSVIIRVVNSGVVPVEIRDRFFDKLVTAGKPGGTGLGTYSAALIVKTQGGTITVETSDAEQRTEVVVTLPANMEGIEQSLDPMILSMSGARY